MILRLAACLALSGWAGAATIEWFSDKGGTNLDSAGVPMDAGFQFQLGVFSSGFTPTVSNVADWADHWNVADQTDYNAGEQFFVSEFVVSDNGVNFVVGAEGWIMGIRSAPTGTERILFRRDTWLWPEADDSGIFVFPYEWTVNGGTGMQVALGSLNPSGTPFLMQSAVVRDYAQWRTLRLAGEPLDGPGDDPDGDGVSNAEEFVFDTDPLLHGVPPVTALSDVEIDNEQYLSISIPRNRAHLANLKVQVSSDLETWEDGPAFTETLIDGPLEWVVRDRTPFSSIGGKRFMRLQIELSE